MFSSESSSAVISLVFIQSEQSLNEDENDEKNYEYREECWITASEIRIILSIIRMNLIDSM